jgi:hypothetical protein
MPCETLVLDHAHHNSCTPHQLQVGLLRQQTARFLVIVKDTSEVAFVLLGFRLRALHTLSFVAVDIAELG